MLAMLANTAAAAAISRDLAMLECAAPSTAGAGLERPQPEPLLKLPARLLRSRPIVVNARPAAVLRHQRHHQVRVVRPAGRAAVTDSDPPALCRRLLAGEPHLADELPADLTPPLVREVRLGGMQCQRAMPHVRVPRRHDPPVLVAFASRTARVARPETAPARRRRRR
jgi:hypothetical protein